MEHTAPPAWVMLAYLISGVFFILALRGLSSPATSQRGNRFGMAGMLIAVVTTLVTHEVASLPEILGAIAIGGGIGWVTARKIAMTDMPQLVAGGSAVPAWVRIHPEKWMPLPADPPTRPAAGRRLAPRPSARRPRTAPGPRRSSSRASKRMTPRWRCRRDGRLFARGSLSRRRRGTRRT